MADKTQQSVLEELDRLEKKYDKKFIVIFLSITVDNGCEFLDFKAIERSVIKSDRQRTKLYYAYPYGNFYINPALIAFATASPLL